MPETHHREGGYDRCRTNLRRHLVASTAVAAVLVTVGVTASAASADTHVGGVIAADTSWSVAGNPYIVDSHVIVGEDATLTIEPGVTVAVNTIGEVGLSGFRIEVHGGLVAQGTESQPIRFVSADRPGQPQTWRGLVLRPGAPTRFDHVEIESAYTGVETERALEFHDGRITDGFDGIDATSDLAVTDSTLVRLRRAVGVLGEAPVTVAFQRNRVFQSSLLWLRGAIDSTITGNLFQAGEEAARYFSLGRTFDHTFSDNTITGASDGIGTWLTRVGDSSFIATGNNFYPAVALERWDWAHSSDEPSDPLHAIDVTGNWWGTTDHDRIDARILDGLDDFTRPLVRYAPTLFGPSPTAPVPDASPPPDTTITSPPPPPTRTTVATTFAGQFAPGQRGSFECRVDDSSFWFDCWSGAVWPETSGPFDDGEHVLEVRAVSDPGWRDPSPARTTFVRDTRGPVLGFTDRPHAATNAEVVRIAWSASEQATFVCAMSPGLSEEPCTSPVDLSGLGEGSYFFALKAADTLGNATHDDVRFRVDRSAPGPFELRAPDDDAVIATSTPNLEWTVAPDVPDATRPVRYERIVDGQIIDSGTYESGEPRTVSLPLFDAGDGPHTWTVSHIDEAGNRRTAPTRHFVLDTTSPAKFQLETPADHGFVSPGATVTWGESTDAASGLDRYEVNVDGKPAASTSPAVRSAQLPASLGEGPHEWAVSAIDRAGHTEGPGLRTLTIDASAPVARLSAVDPVLAGGTVSLDASASSDAVSAVSRYEWDLDGDGVFEVDGGVVPTMTLTRDQPGIVRPGVRVSDAVGLTGVATVDVEFTPPPPNSTPGVTINAQATFTTSPAVSLSVVWPAGATEALVSNDGSFATASTFPVAPTIPWQLVSTGPERVPKTVYVRFRGPAAGAETYQDDILLDQTAPQLLSAQLTAPPQARAAATRQVLARTAAGTLYALRTQADDTGSGVARVQLREPAASAPFGDVPYGTVPLVRTTTATLLVRVLDHAGNASAWREVTRPAAARLHASKLTTRPGRRLLIRYTVTGPGTAVLRIIRGGRTLGYATATHRQATNAYFKWNGRFGRRLASRGQYSIRLTFTADQRPTTDTARLRIGSPGVGRRPASRR